MHILFLGDSHAHALIRAAQRFGDTDGLVAVDVRRIESETEQTKDIPASLAKKFPADRVCCCLGGTEYNLLGLIESAEPFDFLLDDADMIESGRKLVPLNLMKAALEARMRSALNRMAKVRALYHCPITYVAPPPPFFDLGEEVRLPRAFLPHLDQGITPAAIRLKLYTLQVALLRAHCEEEGIDFMSAPDEARDPAGYLLRDFWDRDPTHGNALYGRAVIGQIKAMQFA